MIRNILDYLEQSARHYPDKIAFADEMSTCTYKELWKTARSVGTKLANYVPPRSPVPVFMEKRVETIYAFLGAVYAGCFYVLLDPKLPSERLKQILQTLQSEVLVLHPDYEKQFKALEYERNVVNILEALQEEEDAVLLEAIREQRLDIDPLYAIFTSGSTGIPKGVLVSHRSVIDFMEEFVDIFGITDKDVIGNQAPFDFDVSVKDIYSTLKTGATMQIIPKKMFSFPTKLLDYLDEREITTLIWAVSALCIVTTLKGLEYKVPQKVNKIIFSGEVMPIKHLNEWKKYLPDALYANVYGPTEITCNCTYYIVDREFQPGESLPIGQPFPNEKVFLLDEGNQLVREAGKKGEICVSGTALSLGYYRNPEQTKKVFVQNPLNEKYLERIYRTGDMAYYGHDGYLYFASRKDFQIKHMGHRIELGEIELAMEMAEGIRRACCTYDEPENKIIAFYEGEAEKRQIVRALGKKLPAYMIPNVWVKMDRLPITKNGKIDRKKMMKEYREGIYG
ncbi:amino acid adenylation domain-containing protein [Faecalicatena contorta]|uniref:amino acid adenylation domain-containing protein n=1 Tax=Faecalicatena contorta TaxID=39482 RepID=UPI001F2A1041|nr:amino acid adenylation domain-containing protein [Faecalicatena contorta]MCF2669198.1 amino acid adenylation domain-containing protein [Faecalicatena contorta]